MTEIKLYYILLYSVLFYSVLFYAIPFHSIPFHSIILYYIIFLFCSVLFCSVLFCSVLFCSVMFCSVFASVYMSGGMLPPSKMAFRSARIWSESPGMRAASVHAVIMASHRQQQDTTLVITFILVGRSLTPVRSDRPNTDAGRKPRLYWANHQWRSA